VADAVIEALYTHFAGKNALLEAMLLDKLGGLEDRLASLQSTCLASSPAKRNLV
jgi:hypothetical protein